MGALPRTWAVPSLLAGAAGPDGEVVAAASIALVAITAGLGALGTVGWWMRADQAG